MKSRIWIKESIIESGKNKGKTLYWVMRQNSIPEPNPHGLYFRPFGLYSTLDKELANNEYEKALASIEEVT